MSFIILRPLPSILPAHNTENLAIVVRKEDKETGIVWDPMLRVEEFVDIVKKFVAFSGTCLEIKEKLGEA